MAAQSASRRVSWGSPELWAFGGDVLAQLGREVGHFGPRVLQLVAGLLEGSLGTARSWAWTSPGSLGGVVSAVLVWPEKLVEDSLVFAERVRNGLIGHLLGGGWASAPFEKFFAIYSLPLACVYLFLHVGREMVLAVRGGSLEPEIPFLEAWFRRLVSPIMDKRDIMVRDPVLQASAKRAQLQELAYSTNATKRQVKKANAALQRGRHVPLLARDIRDDVLETVRKLPPRPRDEQVRSVLLGAVFQIAYAILFAFFSMAVCTNVGLHLFSPGRELEGRVEPVSFRDTITNETYTLYKAYDRNGYPVTVYDIDSWRPILYFDADGQPIEIYAVLKKNLPHGYFNERTGHDLADTDGYPIVHIDSKNRIVLRYYDAMNRTAMSLRKMWLDANGTWVGENPHGAKALGDGEDASEEDYLQAEHLYVAEELEELPGEPDTMALTPAETVEDTHDLPDMGVDGNGTLYKHEDEAGTLHDAEA
jgi:hypothetical protein